MAEKGFPRTSEVIHLPHLATLRHSREWDDDGEKANFQKD
jgi:hypothetical protein